MRNRGPSATSGAARWTLDRLGSLGPLGGVVALIWESSAPLAPWARAAGALGFLLGAASDLVARDGKRRGFRVSVGINTSVLATDSVTGRNPASGVGLIVTLILAFNCTTRQHHSAQPLWLSVFGILILAALLGGAFPYAVIAWRRNSDERERAIANGSMAFALLTTILFITAFSFLRDLRVGPAMQPDWALWTAAASWLGAWLYLRRAM